MSEEDSECEEVVKDNEEEFPMDGVPKAFADLHADPVTTQRKPWCITPIFTSTYYYDVGA